MRNSSNNSNRFKIVETLKKMVPGTQARSRFFKEKKKKAHKWDEGKKFLEARKMKKMTRTPIWAS